MIFHSLWVLDVCLHFYFSCLPRCAKPHKTTRLIFIVEVCMELFQQKRQYFFQARFKGLLFHSHEYAAQLSGQCTMHYLQIIASINYYTRHALSLTCITNNHLSISQPFHDYVKEFGPFVVRYACDHLFNTFSAQFATGRILIVY